MNRIHQKELDYGRIYDGCWQDDGLYYYQNRPFTGIMFDTVGDTIISENQLEDGLADGLSRYFNLQGEVIFVGTYNKGYPVGIHKYWHTGNILYKEVYYDDNNTILKEIIYNEY